MDILPQLLINALITGSIYALVSFGLSLAYGMVKILNFAHGHYMMVGAYFFYLVSDELSMHPALVILSVILFCISFGIISLRLFILPFSRYSDILALVSSLALSHILEAVVSICFGVNVKSLSMGSQFRSIQIGSIFITPIQIIIIASALIFLSCAAFIIHSTSLGRKIRALSENQYFGESIGISHAKTTTIVFVAATFLAVYAGILVGCELNLQPTMGMPYTIKAFAAMVLGGLGNLWGTIIGSYFLGLVENLAIGLEFGQYSIPAGYKDTFAYLTILFVLLIKPEGIFRIRGRSV